MAIGGLEDNRRFGEPPKAPDTLDERLGLVLLGWKKPADGHEQENLNDMIAQIKAVFQEAGYQRIEWKQEGMTVHLTLPVFPDTTTSDKLMTGRAWYDRFKSEYYNLTPNTPLTDSETKAFWAAKRAANLEETA